MIVPVFVSAWEMDCCQPDATIGEEWSGCLFLYPPKPWWVQEGDQWSDEPELDVVEFDVDVVRSATSDDAMALVDAGAIRLGIEGLRGKGRRRVRGRVISEWHGPDPKGVKLEEVAREGLVRRVRLVPIEFERRGEKAFYPVARLSPIEVRSTSERRRNYMDSSADRHYEDELLVDLDVTEERRSRPTTGVTSTAPVPLSFIASGSAATENAVSTRDGTAGVAGRLRPAHVPPRR